MQEFLLRIRHSERGLSKSLKKVKFIFLSNPVPFNGQDYKKQKGLGTSDQPLFSLWNKSTKISLLVVYYQTKFDVIQSDSWVNPKITPANLCKPIHDAWRHKLFYFHLFFWIWKVWKGRGKITKIWISREWKEPFRWNKKHFSRFLKGYHLKNSGHKL